MENEKYTKRLRQIFTASISLLLLSTTFMTISVFNVYQTYILRNKINYISEELEYTNDISNTTNERVNTSITNINSLIGMYEDNQECIKDYTNDFEALSKRLDKIEEKLSESQNKTKSSEKVTKKAPTVENTTAIAPAIYSNYPLISDGTVSEDYFNQVVYYYNTCPSNVRSSFESSGWQILVTGNALSCPGVSGRVMALTDFSCKSIQVNTIDPKSVIHEIGHFIDHKNNFCSYSLPQSTYLNEIYPFMSTVNPGTDLHNTSSFMEYFAESFYMYIVNGTNLMLNCPETYLFVQQYANKI